MDGLLATARSNHVAVSIAVQNFEQLRKDYGAEQADVITSIVGNIINGQATGDTAKKLSENFGKIVQDKNSMTINSSDTSISKATQLDYAIPASKIAALELKMFHSRLQKDHDAIAKEEATYKPIPKVAEVSEEDVIENYIRIKAEIDDLIRSEMILIEAKKELEEQRSPLPAKEPDNNDKPGQTLSM